ncbi:hypothetical protein ACFLX7_02970 [Chloroflexota bacterium]
MKQTFDDRDIVLLVHTLNMMLRCHDIHNAVIKVAVARYAHRVVGQQGSLKRYVFPTEYWVQNDGGGCGGGGGGICYLYI